MTPADDAGVGRPISFRARTDLSAQLEERDERVGTAARRDLSRYYAWLADELDTIDLDKDQADRLLLALRELTGHTGGPRSWSPPPGLPLHRYITGELERHPDTDATLEIARTWSTGQLRAVLDAVERAWRTLEPDPDHTTRVDALTRAGLLKRHRSDGARG